MKLYGLFFVTILCFISTGQSEWLVKNSAGDSVFIILDNGNTGILTKPGTLLDINGVIKIRESAVENAVYMSDADGKIQPVTLGGDLEGPAAALIVSGLRGKTVSAGLPNDGSILKWSQAENSWILSADEQAASNGNAITSVSGGQGLTGTGTEGDIILRAEPDQPLWNGQAIQSSPVLDQAPSASHQFIIFNGSAWEPSGTPQTAMWNAGFFQGIPIDAPAPQDSQILAVEDGAWKAPYATTDAVWNASRLQNKNISSATPTTGQVLWFRNDANSWTPGPSVGDPSWNASYLMDHPIETTAPLNGQLLLFQDTGGEEKWAPGPLQSSPVYNALQLNGNTVSDAAPARDQQVMEYYHDEWHAGPTVTDPVWNAGQWQGVNLAATVPDIGDVFAYRTDSGAWDPRININEPHWNANQIAGIDVDEQAPSNGQMLQFKEDASGSRWAPGIHYTSTPGFGAGYLYNQPVSATEPDKEGQILVFENGEWVPGPAVSEPTWNLGRLNVRGVSSLEPTAGQALRFRSDANSWYPRDYDPNSNAYNAGYIVSVPVVSTLPQDGELLAALDDNGTMKWAPRYLASNALYSAAQVQGVDVANTQPSEGQLLQYDETSQAFIPGAKSSEAIWNVIMLQGVEVSGTTPQSGHVLAFINNQWTPVDPSTLTQSGQSVNWLDDQQNKIEQSDLYHQQAKEFIKEYKLK